MERELISCVGSVHVETHRDADEEQKMKANVYCHFNITWRIDNFEEHILDKLITSNAFSAGGFHWKMLAGVGHYCISLGILLEDTGSKDFHDFIEIEFSAGIYNFLEKKAYCGNGKVFQVSQRNPEAIFFDLMSNADVFNHSNGFLWDNSLTIVASVKRCRMDCEYVGLVNQGATCYLNSMLQILYHIPYFRKAIYQIPTHKNLPSLTLSLALQIVFCLLNNSGTSVSTKLLTDALGWDNTHVLVQQDVQEIFTKLCEKLENQMNGSIFEGTIATLFEGHLFNYIECISVDDRSVHIDSFYDLQIDVKGCKDVYSSLDKYIQAANLEGNNKYESEKYGFQEARKGVLFHDLPPILQLHLKRFGYDPTIGTMKNICERFEYPLELDLDKDNGKYLSPTADRSKPNVYSLYSVVVHSGGISSGHYYTFIRPLLADQWYKFDDQLGTKAKLETVLEEHYGGDMVVCLCIWIPNNFWEMIAFSSNASAYLLVYIKLDNKDELMCKIEDDVTGNLKGGFQMCEKVKSVPDSSVVLKGFISRGLFERSVTKINVDFEDSFVIEIEKNILLSELKVILADKLEIPAAFQQLFVSPTTDDNKIDFSRPLINAEIHSTIGELSKYFSSDSATTDLSIFLRVRDLLVVDFHELENSNVDVLQLELNSWLSYDEMIKSTAQRLGIDESKINLISANTSTQVYIEQCLQSGKKVYLNQMLIFKNQIPDKIFYKKISMPLLPELKTFHVSFYNSKLEMVSLYSIKVDENTTVDEGTKNIKAQVELSTKHVGLRILQICKHKIRKVLSSHENVYHMRKNGLEYRAEEIPIEERKVDPTDCLIHLNHCKNVDKKRSHIELFGDPFLLLIRADETLSQLKIRVKNKLQLPDNAFDKVRFAFVHFSRITYLEDDDIVASHFNKKQVYGPWEFYLALQHTDPSTE